jgi:predicted nucleotidyltransferase component of viral defense system
MSMVERHFDFGSIPDYLPVLGQSFPEFYLVGGTALSLCFLDHRLSYDIDLFCQAEDWDNGEPLQLESRIERLKEQFSVQINMIDEKSNNEGDLVGRQYRVSRGDEDIKVDLIRDEQFLVGPFNEEKTEQFGVNIPSVRDLYFRKITIALESRESGIGRMFAGGRIKARDILDLYTLSREHAPLSHFLNQQTFDSPQVVVNQLDEFVEQFNTRTLLDELEDTKYDEYDPDADPDKIKEHLLGEIDAYRRQQVREDIASELDGEING